MKNLGIENQSNFKSEYFRPSSIKITAAIENAAKYLPSNIICLNIY